MNLPATAQSRVTCTCCKEDKEVSLFSRDNRKVNGLQSWCKPCRRSHDKKRDPAKRKLQSLKHRYNLSTEEYEEMVKATPNCPICGSEEPLVVDHDHSTSEVRGLICNHCNLVLGHARDNIQTLKNAITYLEQ